MPGMTRAPLFLKTEESHPMVQSIAYVPNTAKLNDQMHGSKRLASSPVEDWLIWDENVSSYPLASRNTPRAKRRVKIVKTLEW